MTKPWGAAVTKMRKSLAGSPRNIFLPAGSWAGFLPNKLKREAGFFSAAKICGKGTRMPSTSFKTFQSRIISSKGKGTYFLASHLMAAAKSFSAIWGKLIMELKTEKVGSAPMAKSVVTRDEATTFFKVKTIFWRISGERL